LGRRNSRTRKIEGLKTQGQLENKPLVAEVSTLKNKLRERDDEIVEISNAVRMVIVDANKQMNTLPEETRVIRTFKEVAIKSPAMALLDTIEENDVARPGSRYNEVIATEFVVTLTPKNVVTLMGYCLENYRSTSSSFDDLAHIWIDWFRLPDAAKEPLWVWLTMCYILNHRLDRTIADKNGLLVCMSLALCSQLEQRMTRLRK
jgi:hypothetical protein